jgi:hypothetical protein
MPERLIYINSIFAIYAGFSHILGITTNLKNIFSGGFYKEFLHIIHNEDIQTHQLILLIQFLSDKIR